MSEALPEPADLTGVENGPAKTDCWNHIGIEGDSSCPELVAYIHCRNCPVFADAGRGLLNRDAPADYRAEWSELLARPKEALKAGAQSVVIFSIGTEHLALPASVFREVTEKRTLHRLPGHGAKLLMGLVNIRGEIQLCVSLGKLLGIEASVEPADKTQSSDGRMLVVEHGGMAWVLPVNKVHGTHRYYADELNPVPSTLKKALSSFSKGTLEWEGKTVGCLDEAVVFTALKGSIS